MAAKKKVAKKVTKKKAPKKVETARAASSKPNPLEVKAPPQPAADENVDIIRVPKVIEGPEVVRATSLVGRASICEVNSEETRAIANALLVDLAAAKKVLKERRDFTLTPAQETVKRIKQLFDPMMVQLDTVDSQLRARLLRFSNEQRTIREAEQKKLLTDAVAAQDSGDMEKAAELASQSVATSVVPKTRTLDTGGYVQEKEITKFEVTDLGAVPHEYFSLDEKKVNTAIRAGVAEIPGIRIFKTSTLAVGTGSRTVDVEA